ncbi:MAG TPA: hypothetical protein VJZ91_17910, partial [Blastocatellia bacterium]|nr:hypothetical protein [Blastocatellia bacterium]
MRFTEYLAPISEPEQEILLSHWEKCRMALSQVGGPQHQFVLNFDAECRLCQDAWEKIHEI